MKTKYYFSGLIVLVLFFVVSQQRISVPNQEVRFQFSEVVSSQGIKNTLQEVKLQLRDLGASNISVSRDSNGDLKLNYFSNQAVLKVQALIDDLSDTSNNANVQLEISEINTSTPVSSGFDHKIFIEQKSEFDRSGNSNVYTALQPIKYKDIAVAIQNTVALIQNKVLCLSNTLHNIPEVRAGPFTS